MWEQLQLDLAVLIGLLSLVKAVAALFGRKQDITTWADVLGQGLAQELDYVQVWGGTTRWIGLQPAVTQLCSCFVH